MIEDTDHRPAKKTRASASKVRTGCVTCKIRHVKCDESKPVCNRCTSTGRRCDGYAPPKPTRASVRNTVTIYVPPLQSQRQLLPLPAWREVDQFHRFIAPKLSGFFQSDFWNTFILQLSQSEPAIRHAIAAITAINSDIETLPVPNPSRPIVANELALKESSDAMRSLTKRIQDDPKSSLVPLVACLLFTCLECMRGCVDAALIHITNGFAILNTVMVAARGIGQPVHKLHEFDLIERHVLPVFVRLNVVCILFGRLTACPGPEPEMGEAFDSLEDARLQFYKLAYKCARFAREANIRLDSGQSGVSDVVEKVRLQRQSRRWEQLMEAYTERRKPTMPQREKTAVDLLRLHARTISVRLAGSLEPESALDEHVSDFREIVRLAAAVIADTTGASAAQQQQYEPPKFVFEMGVIPPLYFTATRCRVPHIRRQALALLREAPRREGLWNAHVAAKVAEEVVRIEEAGAVPAGADSAAAAIGGLMGQDPMVTRVRNAGPTGGQFPQHLLPVRNVRSHPAWLSGLIGANMETEASSHSSDGPEYFDDHLVITMRTQPSGPGGAWHTWRQPVVL